MLRIESITAELREFKVDTKERPNKLEGWIVALVGTYHNIVSNTWCIDIGIN